MVLATAMIGALGACVSGIELNHNTPGIVWIVMFIAVCPLVGVLVAVSRGTNPHLNSKALEPLPHQHEHSLFFFGTTVRKMRTAFICCCSLTPHEPTQAKMNIHDYHTALTTLSKEALISELASHQHINSIIINNKFGQSESLFA